MMRWLLPPILWAVSMALMVVLAHFNPTPVPWPEPLRWLGLPVALGGLGLAVWARALFVRAGTTLSPFEEPSRLVTGGPFAMGRNPMYLGFVLLLLGTGLLLGDFAGVVVTMGFFMVVNRWYIPLEEARAEARFGAEYAAYRTRVRRWF